MNHQPKADVVAAGGPPPGGFGGPPGPPPGGFGGPTVPGAPAGPPPGGFGGPPGAPGGFGAPPGGQPPGAFGPSGGQPPGPFGPPGDQPPGAFGGPGAAYPPGGGLGPQPGYGAYEFNDLENVVIGDCAKWGKALAIVYFVLAGISVLSICGDPIKAPINIVAYVLIGVFVVGAAGALRKVVFTQGNDVGHMMEALDKLTRMFYARIITSVVSIIITLVVLVIQVLRFTQM